MIKGEGPLSQDTTTGQLPLIHIHKIHTKDFFPGKKQTRKLVINAHSLFWHFRAHVIFYHELRSVRCVTSGESMLVVPWKSLFGWLSVSISPKENNTNNQTHSSLWNIYFIFVCSKREGWPTTLQGCICNTSFNSANQDLPKTLIWWQLLLDHPVHP